MIPAKHGRPTIKPARGHYRRLMQTRFDEDAYRASPSGDGHLDDQATARTLCPRSLRMDPTLRTPLEGPYPQRHAALTNPSFLQSQTFYFF